jgi:hypothetical protein
VLDGVDVARDVFDVLFVDDQRPRARGLEDVGDARAARRVVDRHLDRARAEDPEPRVEELRARRHHHRDAIARLDPELLQPGGEAARTVRELLVAQRLAIHERELAIAVALRLGRHKLG